MERWHYLQILLACLVVTAPLEFLGRGVYRRPRRTLTAVVPIAVVFLVWDFFASVHGVWSFDPRYVVGITLPGGLPLEEALFFLVIPLCALLTYEAVSALSERFLRTRSTV